MARFNYQEAEHYGNGGGSGYFSLKDDGDTAKVRFLFNGIEDVDGYSVHQVEVDGRNRYVNCLRAYNDPMDACPFCKEHMTAKAKMFIPVYNIDEDKVQLWERGKRFFSEISSLCARYANGTHLVSQVFEIERRGLKCDTNTTYGIYPIGQPDGIELEDLPEIPDPLGVIILDKKADDMNYYLDNGKFRETGARQQQPVRRGQSEVRRRTPATGSQVF